MGELRASGRGRALSVVRLNGGLEQHYTHTSTWGPAEVAVHQAERHQEG